MAFVAGWKKSRIMIFRYISCTHFKVTWIRANNFMVIFESPVSLPHPVCDTRARFRPRPTGSIAVAPRWGMQGGVLDEKCLISISHNLPISSVRPCRNAQRFETCIFTPRAIRVWGILSAPSIRSVRTVGRIAQCNDLFHRCCIQLAFKR